MCKFVLVLALGLAGLALAGCNQHVGKRTEHVEVTGRVTRGSQPVGGVVLNLQPIGQGGAQAAIPVNGGTFKGQAVPGKYTFYISEGSAPEVFAALPEKYRLGAMDRQVEVRPGGALEIVLD